MAPLKVSSYMWMGGGCSEWLTNNKDTNSTLFRKRTCFVFQRQDWLLDHLKKQQRTADDMWVCLHQSQVNSISSHSIEPHIDRQLPAAAACLSLTDKQSGERKQQRFVKTPVETEVSGFITHTSWAADFHIRNPCSPCAQQGSGFSWKYIWDLLGRTAKN